MNEKERDLKFIKDFYKINITEICDYLKVGKGNLYTGKISAEKTALVKDELVKRLKNVIDDFKKNGGNFWISAIFFAISLFWKKSVLFFY